MTAGFGRRATALAVVVAAAVLVTTMVLLRRPPPIEERLPRADAAPSSVDGSAPDEATTTSGSGGATTTSGPAELWVHIAGAVASPGVVRLPGGSRVVDAVEAAGGLRADADPDRTNLAAPLTDGQRVVVPVLGQPLPPELTVPRGGPGGGEGGSGGPSDGPSGPIDLNTATEAELDTLPGVGPATATAIISHREDAGPFRSVDDLLDVRGIGEAKLEALRDLVTVGAG